MNFSEFLEEEEEENYKVLEERYRKMKQENHNKQIGKYTGQIHVKKHIINANT